MFTVAVVLAETLAVCLVSLVLVLAESPGELSIAPVRASVSWKMKEHPVSFLEFLAGLNAF